MRFIIIFLIGLLNVAKLPAQHYGDNANSALQLDDPVPNCMFRLLDRDTLTVSIKDFKGTLIILSFWSTSCTSCFNAFPKLEQLQKKWGDRIKVLLINVRESRETIEKILSIRGRSLPDLPSIIDVGGFANWFPHRYAGYYVCINPEGVVKLMASASMNLHDEKIEQLLNGESVDYLADGELYSASSSPLLEVSHRSLGGVTASLVAPFIDYYGIIGGEVIVNNDMGTARRTYVNREALYLYFLAQRMRLKGGWSNVVISPHFKRAHLDFFHLSVPDTSLFTSYFLRGENKTDVSWKKSQICYEQLLPKGSDDEAAITRMWSDLNVYYETVHNINTKLVDTVVQGYVLEAASPISDDNADLNNLFSTISGDTLSGTIEYIVRHVLGGYFQNRDQSVPYVFSKQDLTEIFSIVVPKWQMGDCFDEVKRILHLQGIHLKKDKMTLPMVVFSECPGK